MNKLIPFLTILLLFFSGVSLAGAEPSFDQVDANGDGVLSKQELQNSIKDINFAEADKNQDGAVDRKEFAEIMKQRKNAQG